MSVHDAHVEGRVKIKVSTHHKGSMSMLGVMRGAVNVEECFDCLRREVNSGVHIITPLEVF